MSELFNYVISHAKRGACQCGKCFDAPANPEANQPAGHTADVVFFQVSADAEANAGTMKRLVKEHKGGFGDIDLFDGKEHNYMELGAWIGDQGVAMMLMGLGSLLGLWKLMTPSSMLGLPSTDPMVQQLAGMGMITVLATS